MGVIWRAEHLGLGVPIAIKLMQPELQQEESFVDRFFREARVAALLRSPHIVQVLDFGRHGNLAFLVMELLEGMPLTRRIQQRRSLPLAECRAVIRQVVRGLEMAHERQIAHCDVKPDNVFLVRNGPEELAKILDFGIAEVVRASEASAHAPGEAGLLGTPEYMSPEQLLGGRPSLPGTDVWGLGVLAYECLLGVPPFAAKEHAQVLHKICHRPPPRPSLSGPVPAGFDAWFARACAAAPADRHPSIGAALTAFERLGAETGVFPRSNAAGSNPARDWSAAVVAARRKGSSAANG